jgi:hypothetical protein
MQDSRHFLLGNGGHREAPWLQLTEWFTINSLDKLEKEFLLKCFIRLGVSFLFTLTRDGSGWEGEAPTKA